MLISVTEYAELHGVHKDTVRQKILRGKLKAQKIGSQWVIDSETPYTDHRKDGLSERWKDAEKN